jgi:Brp/Blh family beta-carotene 15,15'-monooxygenase
VGVVSVLYAVVGGAYAALWLLAPIPAAALFILVTWFHWGQGDVHALVAFVGADHLRSRSLRAATAVVRGGLPMLVPLVAFPDRYRSVVGSWVGLFGTEVSVSWLFAAPARFAAGASFLAFTIITLLAGHRAAGETRGWRVDAGETALLWVFFLAVPPLVAIGVYFCIWHALRHVLRVAAIDREALASPRRALGRFARDAAPLTALALVFLVGFIALVPAKPTAPDELTAAYLVFIAVLTLPHVVVVTWMDGREGVWSP